MEIQKTNAEVVLYQPDEKTKLEVRIINETVWLSQAQMGELFGTNRQAITKHVKNIYQTCELNRDSTSSILELVQNEGARVVTRKIEFYNLDVIISVGYRVNTKQGIVFRQWATTVLRQHLLQGYSINRQLVAFQEHVDERFVRIEDQLKKHEEQISFFVRTNQPPHEGVVFQGKLLEGREVAEALIKSAKIQSLQTNHEAEYGTDRHIDVLRYRTDFHDRFLIIDDDVYHFGASLKDLGKRLFAFDLMGLTKELIMSQVL